MEFIRIVGADNDPRARRPGASRFGLALDAEDAASISLVGDRYAAFEGTTRFPTIRRRFAHVCAVWDHYVKVTDWLANQDVRIKQKGMLSRRIPAAFGRRGFPGGAASGSFSPARRRSPAARW
jgi:hypothetical protein